MYFEIKLAIFLFVISFIKLFIGQIYQFNFDNTKSYKEFNFGEWWYVIIGLEWIFAATFFVIGLFKWLIN